MRERKILFFSSLSDLLLGRYYSVGIKKNFLGQFLRFFVTSDLEILRLFRLKVVYEADIIKG